MGYNKDITRKMLISLLNQAALNDVTISQIQELKLDINKLDDLFEDGGHVRCVHFQDIAAKHFRKKYEQDSDEFDIRVIGHCGKVLRIIYQLPNTELYEVADTNVNMIAKFYNHFHAEKYVNEHFPKYRQKITLPGGSYVLLDEVVKY